MHLRRYIFLTLLVLGSVCGYGQSPFNGVIIKEIEIHPDTALLIQTQAGYSTLPRTWRIYACLNDPYWELQAIFGYINGAEVFPLELNAGGANFFQSPFGNANGLRSDSPALEAAFPTHKYDSWFTIGNLPDPGLAQIFQLNELTTLFEPGGNGFLVNDIIGGGIYPSTTNPIGLPDLEGKICVGQFTLEGIFTGTFNFSFRHLNPDSTIYDPDGTGPLTNEIDIVGGIAINSTPGVMDTVCSIQFLPIRLVDFNVSATEHQVNLNWETSSEENNDYFTIERSTDLTSWKEITRLDGAGSSSTTRFYYTIDQSPELGINYYRLTQTDYDGDSESFGIRAVEFKGRSNIILYPNPAHTHVNLQGDLKAVRRYSIYDAYGQLVTEMNFPEGVREIDISAFAPGMYHLDLFGSAGKIKTLRLNIQR